MQLFRDIWGLFDLINYEQQRISIEKKLKRRASRQNFTILISKEQVFSHALFQKDQEEKKNCPRTNCATGVQNQRGKTEDSTLGHAQSQSKWRGTLQKGKSP